MRSSDVITTLILCLLVCSATSEEDLDLKSILSHLKKMCLENPDNKINDSDVKVKCKLTFDITCWKETRAGETFIQPCPFLFYSTKDNVSRRCDEQGKWQRINITNCHRLKPKEAVDTGKRIQSNITITDKKDDSHEDRVKKVFVAISWMAFFVLLPTFVIICIVMRKNARFTLHKNLILAFILRTITLFIHYYGNMGDKSYNKTVCNIFWVLNRYFAASEITWILNEGIFLLRMLVYPFDNESYFLYYFVFGWGFSGVLLFCVYLPYFQFTVARNSERCWVTLSHSSHMLVLYIPLTIMLVINFGIAAYVVQMLTKKLKHSHSSHMNLVKKSAKAVVILISLLGLIYLLIFYLPSKSGAENYFIAVAYPLQGIMVCIFCVYLSVEFRESFRRYWMKWRYGILIETNPYSAAAQDIEPGPSGEQGTSATVLGTEQSEETRLSAPSIRSLQESSRTELSKIPPQKPKKRSSQMSLISRSSDLTKFRLKKVEPEPLKPLRVQSVGPEAWCSPSLQDEAVAWGEVHSLENQEESSVNQGFSAKREADLSHFGNQISLEPKTSSQLHLESKGRGSVKQEKNVKDKSAWNLTEEFPFSSQLFEREIRPSGARDCEDQKKDVKDESAWSFSEESPFSSQLFERQMRPSTDERLSDLAGANALRDAETRAVRAGSSNSKHDFSLSSQLFEHDTDFSTAEKESGGKTFETVTEGSSLYQDIEPSTSTGDSSVSSRRKQFWEKARKLASNRRRSMLEGGRVVSKEDESLPAHQKYAAKQKDADSYKLAWIAGILRGDRSRENESDA